MSGFLSSGIVNVDTIPDSVVSRETDNDTVPGEINKWGLIVETKTEWQSIGARISQNTSGATRAYLHFYDDVGDQIGSLIDDVDVSGLTSGGTFTFNNVNLSANDAYMVLLDAEGASFTLGFNDSGNFPYTTTDIDITRRWDGGNGQSDTQNTVAVNDIGDTGF